MLLLAALATASKAQHAQLIALFQNMIAGQTLACSGVALHGPMIRFRRRMKGCCAGWGRVLAPTALASPDEELHAQVKTFTLTAAA